MTTPLTTFQPTHRDECSTAKPAGQPERNEGSANRDGDRGHHQVGPVADPGRHSHRCHPDVVHPRDGRPHAERRDSQCRQKYAPRPAHHEESEPRGSDRHHHREQDEVHPIGHGNREMEGEHAHEMHAPDPDAECERAAKQPAEARPAGGRGEAPARSSAV